MLIQHEAYQPGEKNAHNNPVDAWADAVDLAVFGYGPRQDSTEPGGTQVIVGLEVYAPKTSAVAPNDRLIVDGHRYEVDGEIADWTNGPYGYKPGIVINLKLVEGGR